MHCLECRALQIWAECADIVHSLLNQATLEAFGQPVDVSAACLCNAERVFGLCCRRRSGLCRGADMP